MHEEGLSTAVQSKPGPDFLGNKLMKFLVCKEKSCS